LSENSRVVRVGERYIVYDRAGGGRIGFVRRAGEKWNAVDAFMERNGDFNSRREAVAWLESLGDQTEQARSRRQQAQQLKKEENG
jgi:hypothetical protein